MFFRRKTIPPPALPADALAHLGAKAPAHRYGAVLVACARWEEADIVEWVEYHRILGFDHIYLYSNDDDPAVLRKRLAPYLCGADPFVTYLHWPVVGQQSQIYLHYLRMFRDDTEWACFLDLDEFIALRRDADIHGFLARHAAQADCVQMNWLLFGNNSRLARDPSLDVLPRYTRRAASLNCHTKNLFRAACVRPDQVEAAFRAGAPPFWHFWDCYGTGMRVVDVLGERVDGYSANFPPSGIAFVDRPGYAEACMAVATVAHFQFKSEEDFLRRYQRGGFSNDAEWRDSFLDGSYRRRLDETNAVYDETLARFWHRRMFAAQPALNHADPLARLAANLALFKPTAQSSVYRPTTLEPAGSHARDHANDGVVRGTYGCHTEYDEVPWWSVDLLEACPVGMIRVWNRTENLQTIGRAAGLVIDTSLDGETWTPLHRLGERESFGGFGSQPLVLRPERLATRHIRLSLPAPGYLHLDEVEVFGAAATR